MDLINLTNDIVSPMISGITDKELLKFYLRQLVAQGQHVTIKMAAKVPALCLVNSNLSYCAPRT
jgi:hypothetical protein